MFKRKEKKTWKKRLRGMFWPEGGWKRYGCYLLLRLKRLNGTPKEIAAGVACGVAISFTPFVGLHLVLGALTAWLVNGNILASAIGTLIGNPWTFPFIWISVLYTGRYFLGGDYLVEGKIAFLPLFEKGMHALITLDFRDFVSDVWPILWPMMVGCIPYYFAAWFISYYLVKSALVKISFKKNETEQKK